jgi:hypothetical protein
VILLLRDEVLLIYRTSFGIAINLHDTKALPSPAEPLIGGVTDRRPSEIRQEQETPLKIMRWGTETRVLYRPSRNLGLLLLLLSHNNSSYSQMETESMADLPIVGRFVDRLA